MDAFEIARQGSEAMIARAKERAREKAAPQPQFRRPSQGFVFPSQGYQSNPREQYARYTNTTFACVRPIANRLAEQSVRLGRPQKKAKSLKAYELSAIPICMRKELRNGFVTLDEHPFLDSIADPNELMQSYHLMFCTAASVQLTGKAYWWLVKSKRPGLLYDIWPIPSHWIEPDKRTTTGSTYLITPFGGTDRYTVDGGDIAYFYLPDPANPFEAYSAVTAAAKDIQSEDAIKTAQKSGFDNGMGFDTAVIVGDIPGPNGTKQRPELSPEQCEQLETRLNQLHKGPGKNRGVIILDSLISDVKPLSNKPDEMDFVGSSSSVKKSIEQVFGVNPVITGENENVNRAAALVAEETFDKNVLNPLIEMFTQVINAQVLPRFVAKGQKLGAWIDRVEVTDPELRRMQFQLMCGFGMVTHDEVREEFGLPPLPDGAGNCRSLPLNMTIVPAEQDERLASGNASAAAMQIVSLVAEGKLTVDAAVAMLVSFVGMDETLARQIAQEPAANLAAGSEQYGITNEPAA